MARHFHQLGWSVIATMRAPRPDILPPSERLRILPLDVTKPESIAAVIEAAGPVDVLVNNAGIGVIGVFEVTPMATIRDIFETNTFGVMAMTQAMLARAPRCPPRGGQRDCRCRPRLGEPRLSDDSPPGHHGGPLGASVR